MKQTNVERSRWSKMHIEINISTISTWIKFSNYFSNSIGSIEVIYHKFVAEKYLRIKWIMESIKWFDCWTIYTSDILIGFKDFPMENSY